jgi:hypothetical protein
MELGQSTQISERVIEFGLVIYIDLDIYVPILEGCWYGAYWKEPVVRSK